jgi:phosphate transport system permease protein
MSQQEIEVKPALDAGRFLPSRTTLFLDRFMGHFIKIGGLVVIVAVLGIFLFILIQVIPLFQRAEVRELKTVQLPKATSLAMGVDEWGTLPFLLRPDGKLETAASFPANAEETSRTTLTATDFDPHRGSLICATSDGRFSIVQVTYSSLDNSVEQKVEAAPFESIGKPGARIFAIGLGDTGDSKLIAAIQESGDQAELHAVTLSRKRSLIGGGKLKVDGTYNLTPKLSGKPVGILVNSSADGMLVPTTEGDVQYIFRTGNEFELRQVFRPFKDLKDPTISSIHFLFGDMSIVVTSVTGENRVFSLYVPPGGSTRLFAQTKEFENLPGAATFYAASLRNKAFLTGAGDVASLRYSTTEGIRWQKQLAFTVQNAENTTRSCSWTRMPNCTFSRCTTPIPTRTSRASLARCGMKAIQPRATNGSPRAAPTNLNRSSRSRRSSSEVSREHCMR